jgi:hypothetical protein
MNKIMKKMYIQPNVEAAEVQATSLMQSASPAGVGINISNTPVGNITGD